MVLPGKRSQGLIFICLTCFTGRWAASLSGTPVHRLPKENRYETKNL